MNENKTYVLDTSAILTYIEDEDGADYVENLLIEAESEKINVLVSFISLTEVFYITLQELDESIAHERIKLLKSLSIKIEESQEDIDLAAGRLKANHRISLADAFIGALAKTKNGILVHKDPEFEGLPSDIVDYRLPYK